LRVTIRIRISGNLMVERKKVARTYNSLNSHVVTSHITISIKLRHIYLVKQIFDDGQSSQHR
jgi:hypothetical protein